jgi:hypothetical protein
MSVARAARVLLAALAFACASGPVKPVIDLTPFSWTAAQIPVGDHVIRYGYPSQPEAADDAADGAEAALIPAGPWASGTRLAGYRYGCARADRESDAACSVFLDFWILELEPPLAEVTLPAYRARLESAGGDAPRSGEAGEGVRDARGHEWYHRTRSLASGGVFSHYSRPIDERRALAVTSLTTRAPDRLAARDLARDAIGRTVISPLHE